MRPKKVILCVDHDAQILAERSFLLRTNAYNVLAAGNGTAAMALCAAAPTVELILVNAWEPAEACARAVALLKKLAPYVPLLVLSESATAIAWAADAVLDRAHCPTAELLERVRVMSARKRGPRPTGDRKFSTIST